MLDNYVMGSLDSLRYQPASVCILPPVYKLYLGYKIVMPHSSSGSMHLSALIGTESRNYMGLTLTVLSLRLPVVFLLRSVLPLLCRLLLALTFVV